MCLYYTKQHAWIVYPELLLNWLPEPIKYCSIYNTIKHRIYAYDLMQINEVFFTLELNCTTSVICSYVIWEVKPNLWRSMNEMADIRQLLKRSFNNFCAVDPMHTWLLKECLNVLVSLITNLVNKSLSLGVFTRSMKAGLVKPLI